MTETEMTTQTFDSVWDAIEPTPGAARSMEFRSMLLSAISDHVASLGSGHAAIAGRCSLSELQLSDLLQGKISQFDLDHLVAIAINLGLRIELSVSSQTAFR